MGNQLPLLAILLLAPTSRLPPLAAFLPLEIHIYEQSVTESVQSQIDPKQLYLKLILITLEINFTWSPCCADGGEGQHGRKLVHHLQCIFQDWALTKLNAAWVKEELSDQICEWKIHLIWSWRLYWNQVCLVWLWLRSVSKHWPSLEIVL